MELINEDAAMSDSPLVDSSVSSAIGSVSRDIPCFLLTSLSCSISVRHLHILKNFHAFCKCFLPQKLRKSTCQFHFEHWQSGSS